MAQIQLQSLAHSYKPNPQTPDDYALRQMTMTWRDGGAYALLGPSGCGKTTLLNIISGLVNPSQGRILFGDKDVTTLVPEQRNIAQVFQFPVIYDTMTVFDNLAFPLRNRGVAASDVTKRVNEVADLLELSKDLKRRAANLTADAKQKISLGRGLVRNDVAAILFDEPLTVIDPQLKWLLRSKLKQIHQQYKLTLIYVTHDQIEALTFAEQVVVMYQGSVVQVGTPQELFERPAHTFVGYFIGSPGMNLLNATLDANAVLLGNQRVPVDVKRVSAALSKLNRVKSGTVQLGIRPEFLELSPEGVPADIQFVEDLGNYKIVTATVANQTVKIKVPEDEGVSTGAGHVRFPPQHTYLYVNDERVDEVK
jgi:glycerol transport system ATP-binding protein